MDNVYRELDDVKAELEKLMAECRVKTELVESLKKDRSEEFLRFQQTKQQAEKQAHELDLKSEEIYELKKIHQDLKSSLNEKEMHIARLSSENKKIQADFAERLLKLEESNRELALALDELTARYNDLEQNACASSKEISGLRELLSATEKKYLEAEEKAQQASLNEKEMHIARLSSENKKIQADFAERLLKLEESNRELALALDELTARYNDLEQNACASSKEISGLRELLSATEKKYLEAEEKAQQARTLRRRDDVILKLEEENMSVQDKIKWRNEQFQHLEEAHEKLQVQFESSKEEWEKERSVLLGEISSLQINLDSQTRILEGVQSRLEMCNHALAHEESKRKLLEAEISEFKSCFKDVFAQCEEKKSEIHQLTTLRNEEIAQLRNSLGEKEMVVRELEFKIIHLEQDNQELGDSLKELREAQIHNAGANSLTSKLRNKLRRLEDVHKNCSSILKCKESQWDCQLEKIEADISTYKSALSAKEQEIREFQMELEKCHLTIEEKHMGLLIFKSELAEALKSLSAETDKAVCINENEDMILLCLSTEQLRDKDDSLKTMAHQHFLLQEEFEQQKKMLEESSKGQLILEEQLLQVKNTLNYERSVAFEAQEKLKLEIANKNDKLSRLDCEAQFWKSAAETLKVSYEEIQGTYKKLETSLLSQIENEKALKLENENLLSIIKQQQRKSKDLQQQIALLEMHNAEEMQEAEKYKQKKEDLVQIVKDKDSCIKDLQKDIAIANFKQKSMRKELEDTILAKLDAEKALEQEKKMLLKIKDQKDQTIKHFEELAAAMEQDLFGALCFSFSKQVEKWVEVSVLNEALKNAEYLTKQEIEEKNMKIVETELKMNNLLENFAHTEESYFHSKQEAKQLQASLEAMKLEIEKLVHKQQTMEGLITELKLDKGNLLQEITKLSSEREDMLVHIEDICGRVGELSGEDMQLMETLENILKNSVDENVSATDLVVCDKLHDSTRDSANGFSFSPTIKKLEEDFDGRRPLIEVNSLRMQA